MPKFVISGGPGAGKSTLIKALQQKGYHCMEEASRLLIKEEVTLNSKCLPWIDLPCFAQRALNRMIAQYHQAAIEVEPVFFDRGIPDIVAYLNGAGKEVPDVYYESVKEHPYHKMVFMAPPWKEIYCQDDERWQTFKEAVHLYHMILKSYHSFGYSTLELPRAPVEERVQFILSHLASLSLPI